MGNKYNIEELKYLLPDLITGQISDEDKRELEGAIEKNSELSKLYTELKGAINIVESVKAVEPPPEYWNNLLPKIHARIEEKETGSFNWDKIAAYWKVLVPIAAVILIAVVYYLVVPSNTELTEKEKIEKTNKDTNKENNTPNKENSQKDDKLPEITNEDKSTNDREQKRNNEDNKIKREQNKSGNDIVKENLNNIPENIDLVLPKYEIENEQITETPLETDIEDMSIFSEGEAGGLGEDIENELSKLDDNEKSSLLQELANTNL